MNDFVCELGFNEVLGTQAVIRLKSYISSKYPYLTAVSRAGIFADAVTRAVDARIPLFGNETRQRLKALLFGEAVRKPVFSIDCADIFKACLRLKESSYEFFRELHAWLTNILHKAFSKERLFDFVKKAHKLMENHPDWDITRIIALLETEMGGIDAETAGHDVTKEAEAPCKAGRLSLAGRLARAVGLDRGQLRAPGRAVVAAGLAASILTAYFLADAAISGMSKSADSTGLAQAQFASGKAAYESVLSSYGERDRAETSGDTIRMRATAYDLSYESCGKLPGDPGYGITFSGNRAVPGRTIAVDPKVIPIGSRVYITFPEEYSGMDGIYRAEDTGRLISGNSVDIFFGEDKNGSTKINESAMKFGVRYVDVRLID